MLDQEKYTEHILILQFQGHLANLLQTHERQQVAPQLNQFKEKDVVIGKERNFDRFQRLYNRLMDAYKSGRINVRPPRITGSGAGAAGIAALMSFVNHELPPDQVNALMSGGGLGVKGKFVATP